MTWTYPAKKNGKGRPKGSKSYVVELKKALKKAELYHGKPFIQHFIDLAYKNEKVAIALASKILPDLSKIEGLQPMAIVNIYQALEHVYRRNQQYNSQQESELDEGEAERLVQQSIQQSANPVLPGKVEDQSQVFP